MGSLLVSLFLIAVQLSQVISAKTEPTEPKAVCAPSIETQEATSATHTSEAVVHELPTS
jgi:hypothetical protein